VLVIDHNNHLLLRDLDGGELFKTSEYYGGSLNFIITNPVTDATQSTTAKSLETFYLYIPARILVADLDGDGRNEVIINRNKSVTRGYTERFAAFSDGNIVSLAWNGLSLEPQWESRKLNGCLTDYHIKDLDNDQRPDLVVALLQKRGLTIMSRAQSMVVSYKLLQEGDVADTIRK